MDIDTHWPNFGKGEDEVALEENSVCMFESEFEFTPVEHPVEPEDEDRPVKCPMPVSSMINNASMTQGKERPEAVLPPPPPFPSQPRQIRVVRKRQHVLGGNNRVMKPNAARILTNRASTPSHNITIYQALQELDEFES